MQIVELGDVVRLRFNTRDAQGNLAAPSVLGTATLYVNGVAQAGASVPISGSGGTYTADITTANATLLTSGSWAIGDHIRAKIAGIQVAGATNAGGWLDDEAMIGPVPADVVRVGGSDTDVAALATNVSAALADTNELQTDLKNGGRLDLLIDAIKAKTDLITSDPATQTSLTAIAATLALIKAVTDLLPNGGALTDLAALETRLTSARAALLDKLNITGNVASQADVAAVVQAARVRISVPQWLERPDSGSTAFRVWIYVYDAQHLAEDLDGVPTVAATNAAGTSRSANLGTVTKPGGTTGIYFVDYTVADNHLLEQISFDVAATEASQTTHYPASTIVVDYTASAFTPTDRSDLQATKASAASAVTAIAGVQTTANAINAKTTNLPLSPAAVGSQMDLVNAPNAIAVTALQAGLATSTALTSVSNKLGTPVGASLSADVAAVKADTASLLSSLAAKFLGMTNLPAWLRTLFGASVDATALEEINDSDGEFDETTDTSAAIAAALAALQSDVDGIQDTVGVGSGFYAVTITVQDQANASTKIENVLVSAVASGMLKGWGRTNGSGQIVLQLNAGTYAVPSGIPGQWQMANPTQTITVTSGGPNAFTIEAVALGSPATNEPGTIEGRIRCRNDEGEYGPGIVVWLRYESGPGEAGESLSTVPFSATTDADGWAKFPGLLCESQLYGWRQDSEALQELVDVPADGGPDAWFLLPEILGRIAEPGSCGCS